MERAFKTIFQISTILYDLKKNYINGLYAFCQYYMKQVGRYRIRIKKSINAYSGKIIKIYQKNVLLSRDSLGLGEPYSTQKKYGLVFKDINIYNIVSFKAWTPLIGPPKGKSRKIDTVSQNRLNAIKNHEIWRKFWKKWF